MRQLSSSLTAKLEGGVTTLASAWRLTRSDGVVVAVTQHDRDLICDGTTFASTNSFVGTDQEAELSLSPDRTALTGALAIGAISEGDLLLGRWDKARVEAFQVDWENPANFIALWTGVVAGASWRGSVFELDIVGPQAVLSAEIGRVYARSCDAALGDTRCKVDMTQPSRRITSPIAAVVSDRAIMISAPTGRSLTEFDGGSFEIITGPSAGWVGDIASLTQSGTLTAPTWRLEIVRSFPVAPATGDMVRLTVGCDKSFATCKARFNNALNFRGQPTLPGNDAVFGGPLASGNSGGKR
jgi:uncharacterized phage protein (TIGR02218 family)